MCPMAYTMILGNTQAGPEAEERVLKNFIGLNVDGVIVSQVSDSSAAVEMLVGLGISGGWYRTARSTTNWPIAWSFPTREAGQMAARYLYRLGHRDIACLAGPETVRLSIERLDGFRSTLAEKGVEVRHVAGQDFEYETGRHPRARIARAWGRVYRSMGAQSDLLAVGSDP